MRFAFLFLIFIFFVSACLNHDLNKNKLQEVDERESTFYAEKVVFTEYYNGKPIWLMNAEDVQFDITLTNGIINQVLFNLKSDSKTDSDFKNIDVSANKVNINTKNEEIIFTGNVIAKDNDKRQLETNTMSYYPKESFLKSDANVKFKDHNIELTSKGVYIYPNSDLIKFTSDVHAYFFPKDNNHFRKQ